MARIEKSTTGKHPVLRFLRWFFGIVCVFSGGFGFFAGVPIEAFLARSVAWLAMGFLLLPPSDKYIAQWFSVKMTPMKRASIIWVLMFASTCLTWYVTEEMPQGYSLLQIPDVQVFLSAYLGLLLGIGLKGWKKVRVSLTGWMVLLLIGATIAGGIMGTGPITGLLFFGPIGYFVGRRRITKRDEA